VNGIPDPAGVSGTFKALERTTPIVQVADGVPTTTSMRVANGTDNEHASVLRLIRENLADFEEFGLVGFEIAPRPAGQHGGGDITVAILNEEHATLLLTYMRNNTVVKDFKKRLVREFSALRRGIEPALTEDEIIHQALAITNRRVEALTAKVAELEPKAELADTYLTAQGGARLVRQVAKTFGMKEHELRQFLADQGLIFRKHSPCGDASWDHYAQFAHYFLPRETVVQHQWGTCSHYTLMVLPRGVELIAKRLRAKGLVA
jgi:phage regulator Rha-like protein